MGVWHIRVYRRSRVPRLGWGLIKCSVKLIGKRGMGSRGVRRKDFLFRFLQVLIQMIHRYRSFRLSA